jgi:hypothetical protein
MPNALKRLRENAIELKLYRDIIDAALDDAWMTHVKAFSISVAPVGNETKWKDALLAKWVVSARRK